MIHNLTPHVINIVKDGKIIRSFPSEGVARAEEYKVQANDVDGIQVFNTSYGRITGIPSKLIDGDVYIVSVLTAQGACKNPSYDGFFVYPGELVRDSEGKIIGCTSLNRYV